MSSKLKGLGLGVVLIVGMSATILNNDKLFEITKNIEIFANVFQQLNTKYVDEIDPSELMRIGIDAMVGSLDPYTNFISESQVESYRLSNEGKYQGFGAIIDKVDDYVTIKEVYEDGAAHKAGILVGDQIVEINGFDTKGKSVDEVNAIAKGVAGTAVKIKVKSVKNNKVEAKELIRSEVNIPNVPYSGRVSDNIGYISLTIFTEDAGANISKALKKMKEDEGLDGIVLDLRNNGGGLLREAVDICNIFLPAGKEVVSTKGKIKERDNSFKTTKPPVDVDIPIVVLTNKKSASASEIVSGVIQDYDRGVVMGQRTYGKGLVQNTEEVGYNSRVKLTTSKYYIPSRRCIQAVEYKNGEPVDIPDEKRSKFKTANGRVVLDGGGVSPDVKLEVKETSEYTKALISDNIIFKYINTFVQKNDSIVAPGAFRFTEYDAFKSFVKSSGYDFESMTEKEILKLKDTSGKDLQGEFDALKAKIDASQMDDLDQYKDEIIKEIEIQIISRYYYQSGKAKQMLEGDTEVQRAISLLNDKNQYNKLLGK